MPRNKKFGTKDEVWDGLALLTKGGLRRSDLMINRKGKVVSKAQHAAGVRVGARNLGAWLRPRGGMALNGGRTLGAPRHSMNEAW